MTHSFTSEHGRGSIWIILVVCWCALTPCEPDVGTLTNAYADPMGGTAVSHNEDATDNSSGGIEDDANVSWKLYGKGTRRVYRRLISRDIGIDVYDAALYLPASQVAVPYSANTIIYDIPRIELRLRFRRNVSIADLRQSADKSLRSLFSVPDAYYEHEHELDEFIGQLDPGGFVAGDRLVLEFYDDTVNIVVNDRPQGTVCDDDVQQLVRRLWLDEGLLDRGLCELRNRLLRRQDRTAEPASRHSGQKSVATAPERKQR